MDIRLDIPDAVPSLNKLLRMHWARRRRVTGEWAWMLKASILERHIRPRCMPKIRVTIERYGARRLDQDNFVGGAKETIMDNLVKEGFVADDSPDHVLVSYIQHIGKPHTSILVEAA